MNKIYSDPTVFRSFVATVFKHIAVGFHIMASIGLLEAQALSLSKRLRRPVLATKFHPEHDDPTTKMEWIERFVTAHFEHKDVASPESNDGEKHDEAANNIDEEVFDVDDN